MTGPFLLAAALGAGPGAGLLILRAVSGIKAAQTNSMTVLLAVWSSYSVESRPWWRCQANHVTLEALWFGGARASSYAGAPGEIGL